MNNFYVFPYLTNSRSAKALAAELGATLLPRTPGSYKYEKNHVLINWGCGECPYPQAENSEIIDLINKVKFFDRLKGTGLTPAYATTITEAKKLGYPVFCRTVLEGHDGKGIVVSDCDGQLVSAKLYVKGIDKTSEYRVHVGRLPTGNLRILGGAKKIKKPITSEMTNVPADARIWCGDTTSFGDFIQMSGLPMTVQNVAIAAMKRFPELTFVAFDIVHDNSAAKAYVIEGNSAPMSTPQTTKAYGEFFREFEKLADFANQQVTESPTVLSQPVAAPVAAGATMPAPITVEGVKVDIIMGKLSLDKVVEGYIKATMQVHA